MYRETKKCRICGNEKLDLILDLGTQALTGIFPKIREQKITSGPLELVKCREDKSGDGCGLVQMRHSYDNDEMYGANYGYRSGLNQSMVKHLEEKVEYLLKNFPVSRGDMVVDIGSNDATLLKTYPETLGLLLVGCDPTGEKFKQYYPSHVQLIADFFTSENIKINYGEKKAKIITSIAMFYDLEAPLDFCKQVCEVLADDGIWVFEQSYLPSMLEANAYDTVCHEHLEYYRLKQIQWLLDRSGLRIIDIETNAVNGGSFSITAAKAGSTYKENKDKIVALAAKEEDMLLGTLMPYQEFNRRVYRHREDLMSFLNNAKKEGKKVFGYGASTKGNVILQFCSLTEKDIPFIAEVNSDKFGAYTPGTGIPIISEKEARALKPDYFMVLPWHFKENIIKKEQEYLSSGGKLFFPLPRIEVVGR